MKALIFLLVMLPASSWAMTFDEVMAAARQHAAVVAAEQDANIAQAGADAYWRANVIPTLGAQATATWRDQAVGVDTPIGLFEQFAKSDVRAGVEARLPLLRADAWFSGMDARSGEAQAAQLMVKREAEHAERRAANVYFDTLVLREQLLVTQAYVSSLQAQLGRVEALAAEGRIVDSDVLRVQVALKQALLQQRTIERQIPVLEGDLGRLVGSNQPVQPEALPDLSPIAGERSDVAALLLVEKAHVDREREVWLSLVPRVDAFGRANWTDNDALNTQTWFEVGVTLEWSIFEAGTRTQRADIESAQATRSRVQHDDARRGVAVQVAAATAQAENAEDAIAIEQEALRDSQKTLELINARYEAGAAILTDLLQAQADVRDHSARLAVARIQTQRARMEMQFATGN
ncbi:MAG: TolC family protein [bacterium]